jgi:hypothetical protein
MTIVIQMEVATWMGELPSLIVGVHEAGKSWQLPTSYAHNVVSHHCSSLLMASLRLELQLLLSQ